MIGMFWWRGLARSRLFDAPDAVVHVSLPARSFERIARQIGMLI